MTESQESSNPWLLWLSAAVVAMLIVVLLLLAFIFANDAGDDDMKVALTPISGGVAAPASLSDSTDSDDTGSEADTASAVRVFGCRRQSDQHQPKWTRNPPLQRCRPRRIGHGLVQGWRCLFHPGTERRLRRLSGRQRRCQLVSGTYVGRSGWLGCGRASGSDRVGEHDG